MDHRKLLLHPDEPIEERIQAVLPGYLTPNQAMEALQVGEDELRQIIDGGDIPFVELFGVPVFHARDIGAFAVGRNNTGR
jgi:hypothetical protein